MKYRRLGSTDLLVSEVGFGCARLGGLVRSATHVVSQSTTRTDMVKLLRAAFDHGITFFDTADVYTEGESETVLGAAFQGSRHRVVIASKGGYCLPAQRRLIAPFKPLLRPLLRHTRIRYQSIPSGIRGTRSQDFSPHHLTQAVEQSLKRLRTDYLDLYQLHSPPTTVLESGAFLEPLEQLKRQGKIRYYGISCETAADARICLRYPQLASLQVRLHLLEQQVLDTVVPQAAKDGIGIIARECYAGGLLAHAREERMPNATATATAMEGDGQALPWQLTELRRIAADHQRPLKELALQFVRTSAGISVVLLGMRTAAQLADNLRQLAAPPLSEETLRALRAVAAARPRPVHR